MAIQNPADLLATLAGSKALKANDAAYQVIVRLIGLIGRNQQQLTDQITVNTNGLDSSILTFQDSPNLPNSRKLVAGTNITLDDSVAGEEIISASGSSGGSSVGTGAIFLRDNEFDEGFVIPGPQGVQGIQGNTGPAGSGITIPGYDGEDGQDSYIPGPQGIQGPIGPAGPSGANTAIVIPGLDGNDGQECIPIPGPTGATGATGATGPAGSGGMVLLQTVVAANQASVEFTALSSTYDNYLILFYKHLPVSNVIDLDLTISDAGGYFSTNYQWQAITSTAGGAPTSTGTNTGTAAFIRLFTNGSNVNAQTGFLYVFGVNQTSGYIMIRGELVGYDNANNHVINTISGIHGLTQAATKIKFTESSGNVSTGVFRLYGIPQ